MHCLRCYIPKISPQTFKDHHLGFGVFTMQGYELRNKEAKYAYFHHSNGKSDVHIQVLKSLYDKFNC